MQMLSRAFTSGMAMDGVAHDFYACLGWGAVAMVCLAAFGLLVMRSTRRPAESGGNKLTLAQAMFVRDRLTGACDDSAAFERMSDTEALGALAAAARRRKGFSLIEVLMSIFIISIGIMGAMALIVLASQQTQNGLDSDKAASAGQQAMRELRVRDMENINLWRTAAGAQVSTDPANAASPLNPTGVKKYCLDPRGIAYGVTANFPASGSLTMPRIDLYSGVAGTPTAAIKQQIANETFTLHDDLLFAVDENNPNSVPTQVMERVDPSNPSSAAQKRYSANEISWFATLIGSGGSYTVSTVILQGRNNPTAADEAEVSAAVTGGVGGVEARLVGAAVTGPAIEQLTPGRWVMLHDAGNLAWYRVVAASEYNAGSFSRDVTLAGRDWTSGSATAVILPRVIGAYERTVRLKTDSLWTP